MVSNHEKVGEKSHDSLPVRKPIQVLTHQSVQYDFLDIEMPRK